MEILQGKKVFDMSRWAMELSKLSMGRWEMVAAGVFARGERDYGLNRLKNELAQVWVDTPRREKLVDMNPLEIRLAVS